MMDITTAEHTADLSLRCSSLSKKETLIGSDNRLFLLLLHFFGCCAVLVWCEVVSLGIVLEASFSTQGCHPLLHSRRLLMLFCVVVAHNPG